jgi:hypothetical protein
MPMFREENAISHEIFLLLFQGHLEKVLRDFTWRLMEYQWWTVLRIVMICKRRGISWITEGLYRMISNKGSTLLQKEGKLSP